MGSDFVIHRHMTGRSHFDLRVVQGGVLRSWSLLKEPPGRGGERRLAIERESFPIEALSRDYIEEEAFGFGRVSVWDKGAAEILQASRERLVISLAGTKIAGKYEFRRMPWYPGNRWMLMKIPESGKP